MPADRMKQELLAAFNRDPDAALDFFFAANEIVADFDDWGPMLQANENGEYSDETAIIQLRQCRDAIKLLAGWAVD
jgi:hypothetical protein